MNFESIKFIGSLRKKSLKKAENSVSERIKIEINEIRFNNSDLTPRAINKKESIGNREMALTNEIVKPRNSKNCARNPLRNTKAA